MAQYYKDRPAVPAQQENTGSHSTETAEVPVLSEFDKLRETLLTDDAEEGWAAELRRYLGTMQQNVTKDTDLVEWWQVSCFLLRVQPSAQRSIHSFDILGPCAIVPHPWLHRARCSSGPGIFCSMRTTFFRKQTDCNRPPCPVRPSRLRRTGDYEVSVGPRFI